MRIIFNQKNPTNYINQAKNETEPSKLSTQIFSPANEQSIDKTKQLNTTQQSNINCIKNIIEFLKANLGEEDEIKNQLDGLINPNEFSDNAITNASSKVLLSYFKKISSIICKSGNIIELKESFNTVVNENFSYTSPQTKELRQDILRLQWENLINVSDFYESITNNWISICVIRRCIPYLVKAGDYETIKECIKLGKGNNSRISEIMSLIYKEIANTLDKADIINIINEFKFNEFHDLKIYEDNFPRGLDLSYIQNLETLTLDGSSINEITGLEGLKSLKHLSLRNCKNLKEIDISQLEKLEEIDISDSSLERVIGLEHLKNIEIIKFENCHYLKSIDLSSVSHLKNDLFCFQSFFENSTEEFLKDILIDAAKGDGLSQFWLSCCYQCGLGIKANNERASYWKKQATKNGYPNATTFNVFFNFFLEKMFNQDKNVLSMEKENPPSDDFAYSRISKKQTQLQKKPNEDDLEKCIRILKDIPKVSIEERAKWDSWIVSHDPNIPFKYKTLDLLRRRWNYTITSKGASISCGFTERTTIGKLLGIEKAASIEANLPLTPKMPDSTLTNDKPLLLIFEIKPIKEKTSIFVGHIWTIFKAAPGRYLMITSYINEKTPTVKELNEEQMQKDFKSYHMISNAKIWTKEIDQEYQRLFGVSNPQLLNFQFSEEITNPFAITFNSIEPDIHNLDQNQAQLIKESKAPCFPEINIIDKDSYTGPLDFKSGFWSYHTWEFSSIEETLLKKWN